MVNDSEKRVVHLEITAGPDKGRMFFLKMGKEALLGRAATADLRFTDPGVSSRHCVVRSAGDMLFVEDMHSRNGIRVNGEPATVRVLDGDGKIDLGNSSVDVKWVVTEAEVPLAAVDSKFAPTLIEGNPPLDKTSSVRTTALRISGHGSTMLEEGQMAEFRAAKSLLGQTVAGYLLLEPIGIGATGPVFRAKRVKDRVEVALKLIRKDDVKTPELLANYLRDTRTHLEIPGAANIVEAGQADTYAFMAMDLYRGRELQAIVADNTKYPPELIVKLAQPLCAALAAAHAKGVLHRDIRPANILIQQDGTPVLLELGLARKRTNEGKSIFNHKDDLSRVKYLSPEITRTGMIDGRADLFSLAATFYFAVTGAPPFHAKTPLELIRKIRWEDCAPLAGDDIPPAFSKVIAHAMNKEPDQRYANVTDFAKALADSVPPQQ